MIKKEEIIRSLIHHQEQVVNDFEILLNRYKEAGDIDEEDTKDIEDFARQGVATDMVHSVELQLVQAENDLNALNNIEIKQNSVVEYGAVVITGTYRFFVGIANHSFHVDGKEFVGLAIDAPIYAFMRGKKAGESFSFNHKKYVIEEIY